MKSLRGFSALFFVSTCQIICMASFALDCEVLGRNDKIHEEKKKKFHVARLKEKHNVF